MKRVVLLLIGLVAAFQLVNLTATPLFVDEALYCGLGQEFGKGSFSQAWDLTVNQAKVTPLLSILQGLGFRLLPTVSPISWCRSVSVMASAVTAWVVYLLMKQLTKNKLAQITAVVFLLVNPFSFFTSRTSLQEPLLTLLTVVTVYLSVLAIREKSYRLVWWNLLGLTLAVVTKLNALIILPGLLFVLSESQKNKKELAIAWRLAYLLLFLSLGLVLVTSQFTPLWETVGYHSGKVFKLTNLLNRVSRNLHLVQAWYQQYLTPLFWLSLLLGSWQLWKSKRLTWVILPASILAIYSLTVVGFFPRYLLITLPFLAIVVGLAVKNRVGQLVVLLLILSFLPRVVTIVFNPPQALIAKEDHLQFYEDWTSGSGIKATLTFLAAQTEIKTLILPTDLEYTFSLQQQRYPFGLNLQAVKGRDEVKTLIPTVDQETTLLLATSHHAWLLKAASEQYNLEEVFASHQDQSRSVLLFAIRQLN